MSCVFIYTHVHHTNTHSQTHTHMVSTPAGESTENIIVGYTFILMPRCVAGPAAHTGHGAIQCASVSILQGFRGFRV